MAKSKAKKHKVVAKKPRGSGKFAKGNTAGSKSKGRNSEFKRKLDFATAFKAAVTITDIKEIAKKLVKDAKAGNVKAAKEVFDRCMGKPPQSLSLSGADGEPLAPITVIIQHGEVQS